MSLSMEKGFTLRAQLTKLLPQLKRDEIAAIEYGEPDNVMKLYSAFRVYFMQTAGGMQFCLKKILPFRGESTMLYSPSEGAILDMADKLLLDFHKVTPLSEKLKELRKSNYPGIAEPVYDWYPIETKEELESNRYAKSFTQAMCEDRYDEHFGKSEVVTLKLPAKIGDNDVTVHMTRRVKPFPIKVVTVTK